MDQPTAGSFIDLEQRAVAAAAQAERLRQSAVAIRRLAGSLTYNPMTGQRPRVPPDLYAALTEVEQVVLDIQHGSDARTQDETAIAASGGDAQEVRQLHAIVNQHVQIIIKALEVLRSVLGTPDGAILDAPYGRSAPSQQHPGALCTIVAERVESLSRALETSAIVKANRARVRIAPATP